jgi:hypothetical protein
MKGELLWYGHLGIVELLEENVVQKSPLPEPDYEEPRKDVELESTKSRAVADGEVGDTSIPSRARRARLKLNRLVEAELSHNSSAALSTEATISHLWGSSGVEIDYLKEDIGCTPWSYQCVTAKNVRINKVL